MNFTLNDNAINFELEDKTDFQLTEGTLNFSLSVAVEIIHIGDFRLLEDGFYRLLESGGRRLLEMNPFTVLYDDLTPVLYDDLTEVVYEN